MLSACTTVEEDSTDDNVSTTDRAGNSEENENSKINLAMSFAISMFGICFILEICSSAVALVLASLQKNEGCACLCSSVYAYFQFTAISCLVVSLVWYFLHLSAITRKHTCLSWDIVELIWLGFYIFNYLTASIMIAKNACGQIVYKGAATLGIMCFVVLIVHAFFAGRTFVGKYKVVVVNKQTNKTEDEEESE